MNIEFCESAGDPNCGSVDIRVARECTTLALYYYDMNGCGMECWQSGQPRRYCEECGWSFFHGNYTYYIRTWGKGKVLVSYRGYYILIVEFDFGNYAEYGRPVFDYVWFLNKDYSDIFTYDKFDPVESIALEARATWDDEIAPSIMINLLCEFTEQGFGFEAPLVESQGHTGTYRALVPPLFLLALTGDPDALPIWGTDIIAYPLLEYCGDETGEVKDRLTVANYVLASPHRQDRF